MSTNTSFTKKKQPTKTIRTRQYGIYALGIRKPDLTETNARLQFNRLVAMAKMLPSAEICV